jgi:hypothetical protein
MKWSNYLSRYETICIYTVAFSAQLGIVGAYLWPAKILLKIFDASIAVFLCSLIGFPMLTMTIKGWGLLEKAFADQVRYKALLESIEREMR